MSTLLTLLRHARREWRGASKPVLAALLVAVAAATGVLAFSDRIERTLAARSGELIGGDAVLSSRQPVPPELVQSAQDAGIATTTVTAFPTVLFAGDAGDGRDQGGCRRLSAARQAEDGGRGQRRASRHAGA